MSSYYYRRLVGRREPPPRRPAQGRRCARRLRASSSRSTSSALHHAGRAIDVDAAALSHGTRPICEAPSCASGSTPTSSFDLREVELGPTSAACRRQVRGGDLKVACERSDRLGTARRVFDSTLYPPSAPEDERLVWIRALKLLLGRPPELDRNSCEHRGVTAAGAVAMNYLFGSSSRVTVTKAAPAAASAGAAEAAGIGQAGARRDVTRRRAHLHIVGGAGRRVVAGLGVSRPHARGLGGGNHGGAGGARRRPRRRRPRPAAAGVAAAGGRLDARAEDRAAARRRRGRPAAAARRRAGRGSRRSTAPSWKLLLGYLPPNKEWREATLQRKRREYADAVPQYFEIDDSQRSEYQKGILHQILIDVPRTSSTTMPAIFHHEVRAATPRLSRSAAPPAVSPTHPPPQLVQRALERVLYIWALRHPASGYVQGINDLATPFFLVFLTPHLPARPAGEAGGRGGGGARHARRGGGRHVLVPLEADRLDPGPLHLCAAGDPADGLQAQGAHREDRWPSSTPT